MSVEKGRNPSPSVHGCLFVECDASKSQQLEQELLLIIHERVPGVGILLHIVSHEGTLKCPLKLMERMQRNSPPR
jgi:hypothetical protein